MRSSSIAVALVFTIVSMTTLPALSSASEAEPLGGGMKDKMLLPGVDEMAKIGGKKDKMLLPDQELGGVNLRQMEEIREQQSDR